MMDLASNRAYVVKPVPAVLQGTFAMKIQGEKTGEIKGDIAKNHNLPGSEGWIELSHFQSASFLHLEDQSGLPAGQRIHEGVEVVGRNCQGVPLLWDAMWRNEILKEVIIKYFSVQNQIGNVGASIVNSFTCKMVNAHIQSMDHMCSYKDGTLFFRTRFSFGKIEYAWTDGGIVAGPESWTDAYSIGKS